jgi:hypothetical protein
VVTSRDLSARWGHLQAEVYANKPGVLSPLKEHIMGEIRANDKGLMCPGVVTF